MSQTETCKLHLAATAKPRCPRYYCLREDGATENQSHSACLPSKIIQTLWIQNLAPELGQRCLEMSRERLIVVFVFCPIVRIENKASFLCLRDEMKRMGSGKAMTILCFIAASPARWEADNLSQPSCIRHLK